jgi:ankyrin repeat protein
VNRGCEAAVMLLAVKGANINLENEESVFSLDLTVSECYNIIMRVLLIYGANIYGRRSYGEI